MATRPTGIAQYPSPLISFESRFRPNAVSEEQAHRLYDEFAVPGSGTPIFQAATANLNPWTEDRVDTRNPERGPLLIISGGEDHTVPHAISHAAYQRQAHNPGVTEFTEIPGRGHSLTIDDGWHEVAQTALDFIQRFPDTAESDAGNLPTSRAPLARDPTTAAFSPACGRRPD